MIIENEMSKDKLKIGEERRSTWAELKLVRRRKQVREMDDCCVLVLVLG